MSNHVHLLIKVEKEDLDLILKRIAGSYVYWYNWKYYRRGHLFQDRFKSEPVEDDSCFLAVLRYIHQNPVKRKIVKSIDEYAFSSYNDYIQENNELVDLSFANFIIGKEKFIEFHKEENDVKCMDCDNQKYRLSDPDTRKIIQKICKCTNATEVQTLEIEQRNKYIKRLKTKGLSIRQISRLTGISKGIIEKIN